MENVLEDYYNYTTNFIRENSLNIYTSMILSEIKKEQPILFAATEGWLDFKGHQWVIDGINQVQIYENIHNLWYEDGNLIYQQIYENVLRSYTYIHHNFGWGPSNNIWISSVSDIYCEGYNYSNRREYTCLSKK